MKAQKQDLAKNETKANLRADWLPISLILLVATALYLYQLGTESLWNEELYSVHDAKGIPHTNIIARPVYYVVLRLWMTFGGSDVWLRALSALFGLGCIFLIYRLGRHVAGETTGLIAAFLLALSPLFINFAQMVRMYTLGTCLAIGGSLALAHALENPTTSSMAWWAGTRIVMSMTAPLNVFLLLPDLLLVVLKFRQQRSVIFAFAKWLLLFGILLVPSAIKIAYGSISFLSGAANVGARIDSSSARHAFPSFVEVIRRLKHFTAFPFPATSKLESFFYQAYTLLLACLMCISLIRKHRSARLLWVAAWAFLPSAALFLISGRLWIDRYLLFVSPYILILLAAGFMRVWNLQRVVGIVVAIIYAIAVSGGIVRYYTVQDRQDWRGVAQMISQNEKPDDTIVLSIDSPKMTDALTHYYLGAAPIYLNNNICPSAKVEKTVAEEALRSLPPIQSRFWLLCGEDFNEKTFKTVFGEKFKLEIYQAFTNEQFYRQKDLMHLFLVTPPSENTQE